MVPDAGTPVAPVAAVPTMDVEWAARLLDVRGNHPNDVGAP